MNQKNTAQESYNASKITTQRKSNSISWELIPRTIGAKNLSLLPIVLADNKKQECQKIGYKDLPIYPDPAMEDCSCKTNENLKEFYCVEDIGLYKNLLPIVARYRRQFESVYTSSAMFTTQMKNDISSGICKMKCKLKCHFQSDDRLLLRQLVVALGTITGFALGSPKRGLIYRRVFWASIGNLMTGALCFPKETDENLRYISFELAKRGVVLFNWWFDQNVSITRNHVCELIGEPCMPTQKEKDLCEKIMKERQKSQEIQKNNEKPTIVDKLLEIQKCEKKYGKSKKENENEKEQEDDTKNEKQKLCGEI